MTRKRKQTPGLFNPKATYRYSGKINGFIPLTLEIIKSDAFKALTSIEKELLIYCYMQEIKPDCKRPDLYKGENETQYFYFPRSLARQYNLCESTFAANINRLVEVGFIDCVRPGEATKQRNIYHYSARWQQYGKSREPPPANVLTNALIKKYYPR